MDPWIYGAAARAAARAAAGAAAGAAAVCIYYVGLGGALRAPLNVRDKIHTAAAPAAAPAAAEAPAPAADPWIHGSIFFIMNHIFYNEMKNSSQCCYHYYSSDVVYAVRRPVNSMHVSRCHQMFIERRK